MASAARPQQNPKASPTVATIDSRNIKLKVHKKAACIDPPGHDLEHGRQEAPHAAAFRIGRRVLLQAAGSPAFERRCLPPAISGQLRLQRSLI